MLGWILLGAIIGIAVITIFVTYLDMNTADDKLKENGIKKAVVKDIVNDGGITHIHLDGFDEENHKKEIEIVADSCDSSEIYEGLTIST